VEWLLLAALGMMWLAFLLPAGHRRRSSRESVHHFERGMELLAQVETHHGSSGRWIVTPRKGTPFLGQTARKRARGRERRRQVFVFLLESIGITLLIGLVPPLRPIFWKFAMGLGAVLVLYTWLLLWIKRAHALHAGRSHPHARIRAVHEPVIDTEAAMVSRHVADGLSNLARATYNGLDALSDDEFVHVVVKPASSMAGA
jgi:Flp pilus assembly protein TadB